MKIQTLNKTLSDAVFLHTNSNLTVYGQVKTKLSILNT